MKTKLVILTVFLLSVFFLDAVYAVENTKQQYINVRYAEIACGTAVIKIDMNDVSSVRFDVTTYSALKAFAGTGYDPHSSAIDFMNKYWIFMKNGQIHNAHDCADAMTKWSVYKTFLYNNPQFVSVP